MAKFQAADEKAVTISTDASGIARITIDRPERKNAVTFAMWRALASGLEALADRGETRVAVICGGGADFCAGADIGEFDAVRRDTETARAYEAANSAAFGAIRHAPFPTLAAIGGICFGGGFGIAAACDLRIATRSARFCVPAARLGLAYPADAMRDIVHAAGAQMAKYLAFSAATIDADAALAAGFLLEVVENGEALAARAQAIAAGIAASAPLSNRASKAAIEAVLSGEPAALAKARALGDATFDSADYAEGRAAFRERRAPRFEGR